jgi:Domain of unknown function (DUF4411)
MTLYLPDANVLIRANADYYPSNASSRSGTGCSRRQSLATLRCPAKSTTRSPVHPTYWAQWLRHPDVRQAIVLAETTYHGHLQRVISRAYAPDLKDDEVETIGRDPFLVAAAMAGPDRVVVTREVSSPRKQRANRKVPDVCATMGVSCITDFELWRALDFRIT